MKTIFRYPIPLAVFLDSGRVSIPMPEGAKVLHVACQDRAPHMPSLWVELNDTEPNVERTFEIVGTGSAVPEDGTHVGTWQQEGFVWHLYEIREEEHGS